MNPAKIVLCGAIAASLYAQIPASDARNGPGPGTRTHFHMPEYRTLAEWETHAAHLRKQILSSAGLWPLPEKTPLHPQIFGRLERETYSVEKVLLETLPGFYLGGNLYRPLGKTGKFPGIASPHGHWDYGRLENSAVVSVPGRAINLARQGYVVFTYDMVGYDDTTQVAHEWEGPHGFGDLRHELWSLNTMGLQLWDSIRAIDFLQSLPDVDPERIAVTGASGGGTQTFLVSAVDPRVKFAAPVNMISAIMQGGTCESGPGLRYKTFNVEIGALMAPRPLLMVSATGDWTTNTLREEFPAIQSIYKLYGKPELVERVQIDAPHNYNQQSREAVYGFFGRRILGLSDPAQFTEKRFRLEKLQDLLALHERKAPDNAITAEQLFARWITAAKKQTDTMPREALRERLRFALAAEWPANVLSDVNGEHIVLSRPGEGDRISGIWIPGKGAAALIVHASGATAARETPEAREAIRAGRPVLMIDAYQTGAAVTQRGQQSGRENRLSEVYNKTDAANRIQDVLTALAFLGDKSSGPVILTGIGDAAIWCAFAAAVAEKPVTLKENLAGFSGADSEFIDRFFIPGIQRAGGWTAAKQLASSAGGPGFPAAPAGR